MDLIKTIVEALSPNLTDNQKGLLIAIYSSATPQQAFDMSVGSYNTTSAKNELIRLGLIVENGNQLMLTTAGNNALNSNNLIDDEGEITEEGTAQLNAYTKNKQTFINLESFDMIKSFYQ